MRGKTTSGGEEVGIMTEPGTPSLDDLIEEITTWPAGMPAEQEGAHLRSPARDAGLQVL